MKKKLEAELISIAHRILKLKNRSELDQLQQETLKLYEKISVLRFVEDNFSDVKPTIGKASAEETLEEIYGIEELPEVKANEVEAEEEKKRAEEKAGKETDAKKEQKSPEPPENANKEEEETDDKNEDKENESGEGVTAGKEEPPVAEAEKENQNDGQEGDADPEQKVEEYQASEEEKEHTEEETDEDVEEDETDNADEDDAASVVKNEPEEEKNEESEEEEMAEEPKDKVEVTRPEEELAAMEASAAAVFDKEDKSSDQEEEKAIDAEVITIEPDGNAKAEEPKQGFDFAFDRPAAPEEPKKEQKEITFEEFHNDYREPEFVKKSDTMPKEEAKPDEPKAGEPAPVRDWRDWEPSQSSAEAAKAAEPKKEEPKSVSKTLNDTMGKTVTLGLNDRIAFEKHLFGGSGEDLNRVLSQLNTFNSFEDARNFIDDLVKPDYNNWQGKEEYEERFLAIVEKKFE